MKQGKSFLKRLLALTLALVLIVSNANLGLLASATAGTNSVTAGLLVAENYALSDAEKNLLKSGYLQEDTYTFNVPSDSAMVAVDTDAKTITASAFENWVSASATIVVGEEIKEGPIALVDGKCTYTYDGNAFAVRVNYVLTQEVSADAQNKLLNSGFNLSAAIADLNDTYNNDVTGYVASIVPALEVLTDMASEEGYTIYFNANAVSKNFKLNEEASAAVNALNAEVAANGGSLNFQLKNAAYNAETSKVAAVHVNGEAYKSCIEKTYEALLAISMDDTINNDNIQLYLEMNDQALYTQWMTFLNNLNKAVGGLAAAAETNWGEFALKSDLAAADYAMLDTLVAALSTKTSVDVKTTLNVAVAMIQANLSMFDVVVDVKLNTVKDAVDTDELVENPTVQSVTLTLAEGATKDEILAAVAASGVESAAKAAWGAAYVEGQYVATATALPETLTEDAAYTITYAPKTYTVTFGAGFTAEEKVVPYGYQLTLAKHSDASQAYDYSVNGTTMTQGTVYTVVSDTAVSRATGKAYTGYGLYNTIADNYANDVLKAILKSGALNGDQTLYLRKPDPADSESLLTLASDKLTAVAAYGADYEGLSWVPATYGPEGTENSFGGTYVVDVVENTVKAIYRLDLSNFTKAEVEAILNNAIVLKAEAAAQIETLDRLASYYGDMGQLDLTKLGAMRGTIEVTKLHEDPAKNEALKEEFYDIVSALINNNLGSNEKLKVYNMLTGYMDENAGGLAYYYNNSAALIAEINSLAGYLGDMLSDDDKLAALSILTEKAGFPDYADKIVDLEQAIADVKADLTAPNAMINLNSANLYKLIEALSVEGSAAAVGSGSPYLMSAALTAVDDSVAIVQIKVEIEGKDDSAAFTSGEYSLGDTVPNADLQALVNQADAFASSILGDLTHYSAAGLSELYALAGTELNSKTTTVTLTYAPKDYKFQLGEEGSDDLAIDVNVTVDSREITLPAHSTTGWVYEYTVGDRIIEVDQTEKKIALTDDELMALANGTLTLSRKAVHKAANDLEEEIEKASTLEIIEEGGKIVGIIASVDCTKDSMMDFATDLTDLGYSRILLNGETLLETTDADGTLISIQTLANAILSDNSFGSSKLISLNANNGGQVFTAKMDLGTSSEIVLSDLEFTYVLTSVPSQMADVAKGLDAVKNYMSFRSNNGELLVNLNLPEKVYEVYLTALIATGNVDISDVNAVNNEIAFNFLYDYVDYILGTEADAQSFQNTLEMLKSDAPIDVSNYDKYYQMLKKALTADGVKIGYREDDDMMKADLTAAGKKSIDYVMNVMGIDAADFDLYLAMIKEYKDGNKLNVTVTATLSDASSDFEAVVIDLSAAKSGASDLKNNGISKSTAVELAKGEGIANGLDFTSDLPARLAEVKAESIVVLLGDVSGDLYFKDGAILDLNGYTVDGDITANGGNLIIVDSTLGTFDCGTVTGAVNGSVHLLAGCYPNDTVEQYLKDGYLQNESGYVQNALYWIEGVGNDLTIVLNSDYMYSDSVEGYLPSVAAIAADIAADLATKYIVPAAVSVDGYSVYSCDFSKLIGLLKSPTTIQDAANMLIDCFSISDLKGLANAILDDLTDLNGIYNSLKADEEIGDYTITLTPWAVELEYVAEGDYIDFGIGASKDASLNKVYNLGLKIVGTNKDKLLELICELRDITTLDVEVDIKKPSYDADTNTLYVAGSAYAAAEINLFNSCTYSNEDYITIFTVLFANAGCDNSGAMVDALNQGDMEAVKDAFDLMTVRDVLNAMKALDRPDDFVALAAAVGVTIDVTDADRLESLYHLLIVGFGKALEKVEDGTVNNAASSAIDKIGSDRVDNVAGKISSRIDALLNNYVVSNLDKKLGNLDTDDDGTYELTVTASKKADATVRGYTGNVNIEKITLSLKVIIFDPMNCLWGDVNHDGKVTPLDASLILEYYADLNPADFVCEKRADVNCDGKISPLDAALVLEYYADLIPELPHVED